MKNMYSIFPERPVKDADKHEPSSFGEWLLYSRVSYHDLRSHHHAMECERARQAKLFHQSVKK